MPVLTADNIPWLLVFVVPGFVAMKAYSLFNPSKRLDWSSAAVEVFCYGSINLAICWPALAWVAGMRAELLSSPWFGAVCLIVLLVSPVLLAVLASRLRRTDWVKRRVTHPLPTAWDYFFEKRQPCWILFTLKNGARFGGFLGKNSFASSYPEPPDLYVEDLWRVDEHGKFGERVEGNLGMFVRYDDCSQMELFAVEG